MQTQYIYFLISRKKIKLIRISTTFPMFSVYSAFLLQFCSFNMVKPTVTCVSALSLLCFIITHLVF